MAVDRDARTGPSAASFDSFAEAYDRFTSVEDEPVWGWMAAAGVTGSLRALDAGCGGGRRCIELAEHFDEVVGIDLSAPEIDLARARRPRANVRYEVADLTDFADAEGFDLVYSSTALHHVPDLEKALRHLKGLVRPGGSAVLLDCCAPRPTPPARVYRVGAIQSLPGDLRRFGLREAWFRFWFKVRGPWLEHLLTDRYLSPSDFRRRYGAVFPGGRFVDRGLGALVWHNRS